MRVVCTLGLLLLSTGSLSAIDSIGSNQTHLGKHHLSSAGVSVSFTTPLANALASQYSTPFGDDAPILASIGEPCRKLHPNKEFESFAHIQFDGKRDETIAHEQSILGHSNDEAIAYASNSILLDNGVLDSQPVTNAQYKAFVDDTGQTPPPHWNGGEIPPGKEDAPVTHVSYEDAQNYAKWSQKRLPTDNEWMSAADQLSWDLEMPPNEWTAAPNTPERAMVLNRRNGSFSDVLRDEKNADTTFRLVSPL